jgi:hypothetical protein
MTTHAVSVVTTWAWRIALAALVAWAGLEVHSAREEMPTTGLTAEQERKLESIDRKLSVLQRLPTATNVVVAEQVAAIDRKLSELQRSSGFDSFMQLEAIKRKLSDLQGSLNAIELRNAAHR